MDAETGVRSPRSRLSRSQSSGHPTTKEVSHVRPLYDVFETLRSLGAHQRAVCPAGACRHAVELVFSQVL